MSKRPPSSSLSKAEGRCVKFKASEKEIPSSESNKTETSPPSEAERVEKKDDEGVGRDMAMFGGIKVSISEVLGLCETDLNDGGVPKECHHQQFQDVCAEVMKDAKTRAKAKDKEVDWKHISFVTVNCYGGDHDAHEVYVVPLEGPELASRYAGVGALVPHQLTDDERLILPLVNGIAGETDSTREALLKYWMTGLLNGPWKAYIRQVHDRQPCVLLGGVLVIHLVGI